MIKSFYVDRITDVGLRINELDISKDEIIQIVYTGNEKTPWVVFYEVKK